MKLIKNIYITLTLVALTSCGELFNFEEAKPAPDGVLSTITSRSLTSFAA